MKGRKKVDLVHIELIKDKTILYEGKSLKQISRGQPKNKGHNK